MNRKARPVDIASSGRVHGAVAQGNAFSDRIREKLSGEEPWPASLTCFCNFSGWIAADFSLI
jgi:hypothetical protein